MSSETIKTMLTQNKTVHLNYQQQEAVAFLLDYMRKPYWETPKYIGIKGTAGTGKTFVVIRLLTRLFQESLVQRVAIVAPTNSACKSLRKAFGAKADAYDIRTIASALGLKYAVSPDGKREFLIKDNDQINMFDREDPLANIDLLIVDEGSMVSKENANLLNNKIPGKCRVLILEDQYQLPPVGEKEIYYDSVIGDLFYELTKTERYAPDSFIYQVISYCRQMVIDLEPRREGEGYAESELRIKAAKRFKLLQKFPESVPENDKGHGYFVYDQKEAILSLARQVKLMLSAKKYDYVRCVCWRNKTVDQINQYVRNLVIPFGSELTATPGELFIANGAVKRPGETQEEDRIIYPTATNLIVEVSKPTVFNLETNFGFQYLCQWFKNLDNALLVIKEANESKGESIIRPFLMLQGRDLTEWKIWDTLVFDPDGDLTGNLIKQYVRILDYNLREQHEVISKLLQVYIGSLPYKTTDWYHALEILKEFQMLVDPIRPSYALTGYGVQGTSFETMYVNNSDITYKYRDANIKNRTLFVGCSRAKKRINVF